MTRPRLLIGALSKLVRDANRGSVSPPCLGELLNCTHRGPSRNLSRLNFYGEKVEYAEFDRKSVRTFSPVNLDPERFVPKADADYVRWLVGSLHVRPHLDRQCKVDGFVPVSATILSRVLPQRRYAAIVSAMLEGGVIEMGRDYSAGTPGRKGRSREYRLTDEYRHAEYRTVELTHPELVKRVNQHDFEEWAAVYDPVHVSLRQHHERLTVASLPPTAGKKDGLTILAHRQFRFRVCEQGRVHHNFANIKREDRALVRYDGKELWGADIGASQPLLWGLTVLSHLQGTYGGVMREVDVYLKRLQVLREAKNSSSIRHYPCLYWEITKPSLPPLITLPYSGICSDGCQNDMGWFLQLCLTGKLYEELQDAVWSWDLLDLSRDQIKDGLWGTVYGLVVAATADASPVAGAFKRLFPNVWKGIRAVSGLHGGKAFSKRMQSVESWMIYGQIVRRLFADAPGRALLSVHDCLCGHEEDIGYYAEVMREEFDRVFGAVPTVAVKPFAPTVAA